MSSDAGNPASCAKLEPIHSTTPLDADKWTVSKGAATETHTFYFFTKDNTFIFCQLAYAKVSFITNIQVTFSVISPSGHAFVTSACSTGSFKTTNNDLNAQSDNMVIERTPDQGFKLKLLPKSGASGELLFKTTGSGLKVGEEQANVRHSFYIPCEVTGCLEIKKLGSGNRDMAGTGFFGHATLTTHPYSVFTESHFVLFHSEKVQIINLTYKALHKDSSDPMVVQCFVFVDNQLQIASATGQAAFKTSHNDKEVDLVVPDAVEISFEGPALASGSTTGQMAKATILANDLKVIERVDVLHTLPYMLRKIVQAFITKPYIYQFYVPAQLNIEYTGSGSYSEPMKAQGQVYYELFYL